jgi:hypothetical protein
MKSGIVKQEAPPVFTMQLFPELLTALLDLLTTLPSDQAYTPESVVG